ncbi:MAG TPA: carboxypeptidase regulatory-like domain-containing protein [Anaerolineae bacterium]|nr:carboxypeptidase regulatory-like domain-containing protein [Anaerolineae bacterium]
MRIDSHGAVTGMWTPLGQSSESIFVVDHLIISGTSVIAAPEHDMPIQANNVSIYSGANLTHQPATITDTYSLQLNITGTLLISTTGKIDVSARGYLAGRTLGNTTVGGATVGAGGSYGGLGHSATYDGDGQPNTTYGDYRNPNELGSGRGPGWGYAGAGAGGGLARITAGTAIIEGSLLANGENGRCDHFRDAAGSGGGILLNVGVLSGNGLIAANGGNGICNGGAGGGGRVAVYYWDNITFLSAKVTTNGGTGGAGPGQPGSVYISNAPYFIWSRPVDALFYDTERLEWAALGINPVSATVNIAAFNAGQPYPLGAGLAPLGDSLDWDTTSVPDGQYELRATFYKLDGQVIGQATRNVLVNNSVAWHGGRLSADETWTADRVHVVEAPLNLATGITLTIQAGAVVKFAAGTSLVVEDNAILNAQAVADAPIILTSLADDTAGGDTNLDGNQTLPVPGDWNGLSVQGTGQVNLSPYVVLRYVRLAHSGALAGSETWQATFVHEITGDVTIPSGATLTIQPGAVVKFGSKLGLTVQAGAQLIARGSVAQPVVFTSIRDDAFGGDTNHDGDSTAPAAGDWRWIYVAGQASLDHAILRYGAGTASGNWDTTGVIRTVGGAIVNLSNSLIADAFYEGITAYPGGDVTVSNSIIARADRGVNSDGSAVVRLTNCTLDANRIGVWGHSGHLEVQNTVIANSLEAGFDNVLNSPFVFRYNNVWSTTGANYVRVADQTGLNGNVSVDPQFKDAAGGNYRLRYVSPMIDAADGAVAPATDIMGAPRYDDPRTPNTGVAAPGGAFADMGAYEFVETAQSNLDLVVGSVVGPLQVTAMQQVQVMWTVRNIGAQTIADTWRDALALVGPDGTALEAGEFVSGATLGPNQTATFSATVRVPGGTEGDYRWQVRVNSRGDVFEGQNWGNNTGQSAGVVRLSVPELAVGQSLPGTFNKQGEALIYKLRPALGQDVLIQLDRSDSAGWTQLYIGRGQAPTTQQFYARSAQWNQPDAGVVINNADGGLYYVLALAQALPNGPATWQLTASEAVFALNSLDLARGSNLGRVTVGLNGVGFRPGMQVHLVQGGVTRAADSVSVADSTLAYATFDLQGLAAGQYDVRVSVEGASQTLTSAFGVIEGGSRQFKTHILMPDNIRAGRDFVAWIEYTNLGDVDLYAPLVLVESPTGCQLRLDKAVTLTGASLLFQAVSMDGPAGILRPGQSGRVAVYVRAVQGLNTLNTSYTLEDYTRVMDWEQIKAQVKPTMAEPDWDTAWNAVIQGVGTSWGDYVKVLARAATLYSVRTGSRTHDPATHLSYAILDKLVDLRTVLSGYVYLNDVLHPLGGVSVTAAGPTTGTLGSAVSTADGLVRFTGLAAVSYTLQFGAYLPPADRRPVTVTLGPTAPYTWIVMWGGQIGGRVITPPDFDLAGGEYSVTAMDAEGNIHQGALDAQGGYKIDGLAEGVYTLRFADTSLVPVQMAGVQVREGQTTHAPDLVAVAGGSIAGTVRQSDTGAPLVGVHVWVSDGSYESRVATSDEQGHYRLDGVLPGIRSVTAAAADRVTQVITDVAVSANALTAGVDMTLATGATLQGVIYAQGAPLDNVVVSLLAGEKRVGLGISGPAGEYSIGKLAGGTYTLELAHTQYPVFTSTLALVAGQTLLYNVTLTPTAMISGVVRTTAGRPLENVLLNLRRPDGATDYVLTNKRGLFSFSRLYTGTHRLMLDDGSHRREVNIPGIPASLDASLIVTGGSIRGRLLAAEGSTPISDVLVSLAGYNQVALIALSQEDGVFTFSPVSPGVYTLTFNSAQAWFPSLPDVTVTDGQQTELGDIRAGSARLDLSFYDLAASQLITGGGLVILGRPDLPQPLVEGRIITVPTSGAVSISGLTPGVYRLSSVFAGKATHQVLVTVNAGANALRLNLDVPATLAGQVTDSYGTPLRDVQLTVYDPAQPAIRWQVLSGDGGAFEFPTLPPGTYKLAAADLREDTLGLPCGPVEYPAFSLAAGAVLVRNVALPVSTISVSGRIQDETGSAPAFAQVAAYSAEGIQVALAQADGDGYYTLRSLAPGTFELRANAVDFAVAPRAITLTAGETRGDVDLAARWAGLSGVLSQEAGAARLSLLLAPQAPQVEWGDTTWWSETAAFNNAWAIRITQWLRDALGAPKAKPRVQSRPPHYDPDCPHGMEYWAIAIKYQRAADGFYDGWVKRWDGYMQELGGNVGLTAIHTLKLLSNFLSVTEFTPGPASASYNSVRAQLQSELQAARDPRSIAMLEQQIDRLDNTHMQLVQSTLARDTATARYGGKVVKASLTLMKKLQDPRLFKDPSTLASFSSELVDYSLMIAGLLNTPYSRQAGILNDTLKTLQASIQTWIDTTASLRDLKNAEADYNNAQHMAHFYAGLASDAFEKCWEDECNKPKEPPKPDERNKDDSASKPDKRSGDPNDKATIGVGAPGYVLAGTRLVYTIHFENVPTATAPAQQVVITDVLSANLDWSTFELLGIGFNNTTVNVPSGLQFLSGEASVSSDPNPVRVTASINAQTGVVRWDMRTMDRVTGDWPEDPLAGFLPPNDDTHRGEGYVMFTIRPRADLAHGAVITDQARIVFDVNEPIDTNVVTNTLDLLPPVSRVEPLSPTVTSPFVITWSGSDSGAGVRAYDIYVATDDGPFVLWQADITTTQAVFIGEIGHHYAFYSIATDYVGHREAAPEQPDAVTTVVEAETLKRIFLPLVMRNH